MSSDSGRSFDGGCFLFTCGCLSGGCLGAVTVLALAVGLFVYSLQVGFVNNPRDYAYIHIEGDEMSPALENGDWVLVRRGEGAVTGVRRGDLLWVEPPEQARRTGRLILRAAGLPGESVSFAGSGELMVAGAVPPDSPFVGRNYQVSGATSEIVTLGENEYFLLGEDPHLAKDSRHWGPIPATLLRGKAVAVIYPPARLRLF